MNADSSLSVHRISWVAGAIFLLVLIAGAASSSQAAAHKPDAMLRPPYQDGFPVAVEAWVTSAITLADINNSPESLEILFGDKDGWVYAFSPQGDELWRYQAPLDYGPYSGPPSPLPPHCQEPIGPDIHAAVGVGDVTGDGAPEIVVSFGSTYNYCEPGGVVVLDNQGNPLPNWPFISGDEVNHNMTGPDGIPDPVLSAPVLVDLDHDGIRDIVVSSINYRLYAWHADGSSVDGFPYYLADTSYSSPAAADLDNDGFYEIVVGSDSHWQPPPSSLLDGGMLHIVGHHGQLREDLGGRTLFNQTIMSSPAIGDIDDDGALEIIHGTGQYFPFPPNPSNPIGWQVHAREANGSAIPGWPAPTDGQVLSSPALGDLDGDGDLEIIAAACAGDCKAAMTGEPTAKLYAWHHNGTLVNGWPVTPIGLYGYPPPDGWGHSPIIVDLYADSPGPEVIIPSKWELIVFAANGQQLTYSGTVGDPNPGNGEDYTFLGHYSINGTPAAADIDDDGCLEVVVGAALNSSERPGVVYAWQPGVDAGCVGGPPAPPADSLWPMFHQNPLHTGVARSQPLKDAEVASRSFPSYMRSRGTTTAYVTMRNTGLTTWTRTDGYRLVAIGGSDPFAPTVVELAPGDSVAPGQSKTFAISLTAPVGEGYYLTDWRMARNAVVFGMGTRHTIKVGSNPSLYTLYRGPQCSPPGQPCATDSGLYPGGIAPSIYNPNSLVARNYWNWPSVKEVVLNNQRTGYYILDVDCAVWNGGDAAYLYPHQDHLPIGSCRDLALTPDGTGFFIVTKYGEVQSGGNGLLSQIQPLPFSSPFNYGLDLIVAMALTSDGRGVYLMDRNGNLHRGGNAPALTPGPGLPLAAPNAIELKLTPSGQGYYVLDNYGNVYRGGNAPAIPVPAGLPWSSSKARDFDLSSDGQGYYLLDSDGRVYNSPNVPPLTLNLPPVWPGADRAMAIEIAESLANPTLTASSTLITLMVTSDGTQSTGPAQVAVQTLNGPDTDWEAEVEPGVNWLQVSPPVGSTPSLLQLAVSAGPKPLGTYTAEVEISSDLNDIVIQVRVLVVDEIYSTWLPAVRRNY